LAARGVSHRQHPQPHSSCCPPDLRHSRGGPCRIFLDTSDRSYLRSNVSCLAGYATRRLPPSPTPTQCQSPQRL